MIQHRVWRVSLLATLALSFVAPAHALVAQSVAAAPDASRIDARVAEKLLARPVSADLDYVPLRRAIDVLMANADVHAAYREEVLGAVHKLVTLHVEKEALGVVLERVLAGTGLHASVIGANVIKIGPEGADGARDPGVIVGRVSDAKSGKPIAGVAVTVKGTRRSVATRDDGSFRLAGVDSGVQAIVFQRLGYAPVTRPVRVREGATDTLSVVMIPAATALTEVVTTATGDRQRLEVGNAVGTIKADSVVATTLIRNVSDLLQARLPGVVVSNTDGAVGSPSKIRLRGVNSLALNNDPIIILDGVRLNAQTTVAPIQTNVGSAAMLPGTVAAGAPPTVLAPSRLDDIDPTTIESIDVLRGPSASSLYGTDAANGVIVIKTKKGQVGSWRTTLVGDAGWSAIPGRAGDMWWGFGEAGSIGGYTAQCALVVGGVANQLNGGCAQDSVLNFNPENDPQMRTLGTGTARSLTGSLSGGTTQLQQFFSLRASDNVGMTRMSLVEQRIIGRLWSSPAPSWMLRPNTEQDIDGSSRTTFHPTNTADISLTGQAVYRNVLNGGSGLSGSYALGFGTSPSDTLGYLPSESQRTKLASVAKRGLLSSNISYRPLGWLGLSGVLGGDYTIRNDGADIRSQDCTAVLQFAAASGACPSGHTARTDETFVKTANGGANLTFNPLPWLNLLTSLGEQYSHTDFHSLQAGNNALCPLAFGSTLLSPSPVCSIPGSQLYSVTEGQSAAASAGWYVEETVNAFGLYNTFGVRQDVASAFGSQVNKSPPNYPKFNLSYPISEKSFFPKQDWVSSLRLRLAYGQSGNQASKDAVLNNYELRQAMLSGTLPTNLVLVTSVGNPDLRPERGTEWEGGFDISFLPDERLHAEVTLYRKFTRDAITQVSLPSSYGVQQLFEYVNLGNVENRGLEVAATARIVQSPQFEWSISVNGTHNTNKLVHKASSTSNQYLFSTQFREGYPLFGFWGAPVESFADVNGDGILAPSEVNFGALQFMGAPYPTAELTYNNNVSLFHGALQVSGSFDQILGQTQLYVLNAGQLTRGAVDRTSSLAQQAAWIQAYLNNGYMGTSSSVRFNELSATYNVPVSFTRRVLHMNSAAVTLAGRNIALWTNYVGKDPNVDSSGLLGEVGVDGGASTPQPRNWTLRFNLGL